MGPVYMVFSIGALGVEYVSFCQLNLFLCRGGWLEWYQGFNLGSSGVLASCKSAHKVKITGENLPSSLAGYTVHFTATPSFFSANEVTLSIAGGPDLFKDQCPIEGIQLSDVDVVATLESRWTNVESTPWYQFNPYDVALVWWARQKFGLPSPLDSQSGLFSFVCNLMSNLQPSIDEASKRANDARRLAELGLLSGDLRQRLEDLAAEYELRTTGRATVTLQGR